MKTVSQTASLSREAVFSIPVTKCKTLTHIVKMAEAQTGAGTATVTRELAARVNDGAAPGDVVSGAALTERVRNKEFGKEVKNRNSDFKPTNQPAQEEKPKQKEKTTTRDMVASCTGFSRARNDEETADLKKRWTENRFDDIFEHVKKLTFFKR